MSLEIVYRGGIGWDNLPPHIDSPKEWEGKDDSKHFYTDWIRYVKGIFAYSWTKKHWFGKIRKYPVTLFAVFGPGESRWESDLMSIRSVNKTVLLYYPPRQGFYISRVQYWCDWHIQINWPAFICFHFKYGRTGVIMAYAGWKRDTDAWWFPTLWIGKGYK
jgi:hypothetical protein